MSFTQSHYSVGKGASFMGFGTDSVRYIKTSNGSMRPDLLEQSIIACKDAVSLFTSKLFILFYCLI